VPLISLGKKITLLNRPTSQLPLVRTRWQEFSVSPVTLTLHPKRHALARSENVVITSESARRTRERSAFGRNSVLPIWGRFAFSGAPPLLRGGWPCFVGRGFLRFVFVADYDTSKNAGAKPCIMNTCAKMVGGWGTCCDAVFQRVACSRSEPVEPGVMSRIGKCRGFILLHYASRQPPWNDTLAEKHRGAGVASTETLILLAANVTNRMSFAALKESGRKLRWG
jgi:hypothetical protein